jgi:hypothetical protein
MFATRKIATSLLAISAVCGPVVTVSADGAETERLVQSTTESRTYVHFKVSNDVVQKMLPAGWVSAPGSGALKDANLIVLLVEGLAADGADGKAVLNQGKFALWAIPAKNEQTGGGAIMIIGGLTSQPQAAPGAYAVYAPAKITMAKSARSEGPNVTTSEENWQAANDAGDQLRFAVAYERGIGTRGHVEPRVHSATKPDFYRVYKADQVTDVVHSVVPDMRRAKTLEFNASGPNLSKIFDGKEQLVAVTSIPAYYRQIFVPR